MTARNGSAEWHPNVKSGSRTVGDGAFQDAYSCDFAFDEVRGTEWELTAAEQTHCSRMACALEAYALFVSLLQRCDEPSAVQVRQAVAVAIRAFGCSGCAERVALEFGDHPETAVARMRWARATAGTAFEESAPEAGSRADATGRPIACPAARQMPEAAA